MAGPIARSASSRWMSRPSTPLLHTVMAGRRHEACFAPPFTPHSTKSWPGFVPAIHVLLLHEPVEGRGYPGHRREAKLRRLARARRERKNANKEQKSAKPRWPLEHSIPEFPTKIGGHHMTGSTDLARDSSLKDR